MSMTLEEVLALVRNGEVDIWMTKIPNTDELRQRIKDPHFTAETVTRIAIQLYVEHRSDKEKTFEIRQAVNEHANDVYLLLNRDDTRICMSPSQHWQSYEKIEDEGEEPYYRCNLCVAARDEMVEGILPLPPAPATILDFQAHQKRKREG